MHNNHIMIDIETLSTENNAAVIAIGVVRFDLDVIGPERLFLINPSHASGSRDPNTLMWWDSQPHDLRQFIWSGYRCEEPILQELADFVRPEFEDAWVWAKPAQFDIGILQTRYREASIKYPFNWRNIRDLSTLASLAKNLGIDYSAAEFEGFRAHNPLDDSIKQARQVQIILKFLKNKFLSNDING